jgi:hypothetical protein
MDFPLASRLQKQSFLCPLENHLVIRFRMENRLVIHVRMENPMVTRTERAISI